MSICEMCNKELKETREVEERAITVEQVKRKFISSYTKDNFNIVSAVLDLMGDNEVKENARAWGNYCKGLQGMC